MSSPFAERPTNVRWAVFTLACGTSWLLYLHRYLFALIKADLVKQWHLSKTELGFLDSTNRPPMVCFSFRSASRPMWRECGWC